MLTGPTLALLLTAASSPAESESVRASVHVDASALGDAGDVLGELLQTRGEEVLREAAVVEAHDEADPVVLVKVEPLPGTAGYRCAYELRRDGEVIDGTQASSECRLCTDAELSDQVAAAIARLVPKLPRTGAEPVPPPRAGATTVDRDPNAWVIGGMGQAGIGVSVIGAAVLGVGLGLAIGGGDRGAIRVSGIGTAAAGGALLITGVVLLAVDRTRSRRVTPTAAGLRIAF
jgi:hypothetical protein